MKSRTIIVILIAIIGVVSVWFFQKRDVGERAGQPIRVGTFTKSLGNSPFHIAHHFDWFKGHPGLAEFDIVYTNYNDRQTISADFAGKKLNILFSAAIPQILCKAQGNQIRIVAMSGSMGQDILVPISSSAKTLADLKGKSIAVQTGTSSYFGLLKLIEDEGYEIEDFDLRYMKLVEGRTAFETGQLDGWAVWAPYVEDQQANGRGKVIEAARAPIQSTVAASDAFIASNPEALHAFLEVIARAKKWITENPQETAKIISTDFGLDQKVIEIALPKFDWLDIIDESDLKALQWKATFMAKEDQTRTDEPVDVAVDLLNLNFQTVPN